MANIPELLNLQTTIEQGAPEVEVYFDRFKLGLYNLDMNNVIKPDSGSIKRVKTQVP